MTLKELMYLAQWYINSEWQNRDSKYGSLMQTCTKTCSLYCFDSVALYFSAVNETTYKNNTQLFGLGQPQSLICSSSLFYNQKIRDQRSHRFTQHLLLTTEFWDFFFTQNLPSLPRKSLVPLSLSLPISLNALSVY